MTIIDNGVYVNGQRTENPNTLESTYAATRDSEGMAWIGLYRPSAEVLHSLAEEFGLHPLAVEDALKGHQRAKAERYGDTLFVVLRPARYVDKEEEVEFGELHVFVGPGFVITVRHAESPDLVSVRRRMESNPELLRLGPEAVLYAIMDEVVDQYSPVITGIENDIDEIEDQLFGGDTEVSRRIYSLLGEVTAFQRAVRPLVGILEALRRGSSKYNVDEELQRSLRDVLDHVLRINEHADNFRMLLQNALTVHSTLTSQRQNEEMRLLSEASLEQNEETKRLSETSLAQNEEVKKISSWAAILFGPTLIGTVYGMNFDNMPELHWEFGYPMAVGAMVLSGTVLWGIFRKNKWL
ncbi:magnesium and cobalt transport protein CorA [Glaciibacter psychrotolerans]|uniref:Magnesium transporter n=1 Tax=Glaciibacter psychrotolerans TaxID=670054 RepID=A0A7Z0EG15_9MICO|nr:magnesium and cobalt transport protein CorA [Leifsonia psychrotolerans]NYJ20979.1 magnesium transporter [Leifsonia psychrotolerans]